MESTSAASPEFSRRLWVGGVIVVIIALITLRMASTSNDEITMKVRTDFLVGSDTTFVDGLNVGISRPRMRKDFANNLIEVRFDFDTSKVKSDPSRSFGLVYRFYDASGKPVRHEQVDYEMTQNIITAASGGTREGSVTHALDMVALDPATLRIVEKATIGFLSPEQIQW